MSFTYELSKTVTLATGTTAYALSYSSGSLHGLIQDIYVKFPVAAGAGEFVLVTTTSTSRTLLKVTNPSSAGTWYYPREIACGTTANALQSTVQSSSGASGPVTVTVRVV
jgi:hypothetical protein